MELTEHGVTGVAATVLQMPSEANRWTAVVQVTLQTERGAFAALGEASAEAAPDGRPVEAAETRALQRALRLLTPNEGRIAEEVPAWLQAEPAPAPKAPEPDPAPAAPAATPEVRPSRTYTTARSLWSACSNRGVAAPEPDPSWDEARLRSYVATWSAALKQAAPTSGRGAAPERR
jgi:hypothetical protein